MKRLEDIPMVSVEHKGAMVFMKMLAVEYRRKVDMK